MLVLLGQPFIDGILACLTNGVIITDSSDRITIWNAAAEHILHLDSRLVLGKRYQDVFSAFPQLGLIGVVNIERMQHPLGSTVRVSVEGNVPGRGQVNLNLCIRLLATARQKYLGMVMVIDDRTEMGSRR